MKQKSWSFGENSIIKNAIHKYKIPINIHEVDIKSIVLSDKNHKQKGNAFPAPLCIKLPQMNGCSKYFGKNSKYIKF